jgi:uncharacterized protein YdhG (YjbR/CyaY superfamily)
LPWPRPIAKPFSASCGGFAGQPCPVTTRAWNTVCPATSENGKLEVSFASQKQYISLYALKEDVVNEFRAALKGCNIGKGCIRFSNQGEIDFEVVEKLLRRTAESASRAC